MTDHSLADHPDQAIVLLFVPGAFTLVCTEELCTQSREIEAYEELDAVVYGITVDSAYCQAAWARQEGITITLLSDFTHRVTQAYDVVLPDLGGLGPASKRAVFIIKDGVISYSEVTASTLDMPDFTAVRAALSSLARG